LENKSKELGVFTIGLGMIGALLTLYVVLAMSGPAQEGAILRLAILMIPSLVFVFAGIWVLAFPCRTTIRVVVGLLIVALIADALFSFNPIKCLISFGVACLVWKTARQAMEQLQY
jgi:uncharacterized membrane protein